MKLTSLRDFLQKFRGSHMNFVNTGRMRKTGTVHTSGQAQVSQRRACHEFFQGIQIIFFWFAHDYSLSKIWRCSHPSSILTLSQADLPNFSWILRNPSGRSPSILAISAMLAPRPIRLKRFIVLSRAVSAVVCSMHYVNKRPPFGIQGFLNFSGTRRACDKMQDYSFRVAAILNNVGKLLCRQHRSGIMHRKIVIISGFPWGSIKRKSLLHQVRVDKAAFKSTRVFAVLKQETVSSKESYYYLFVFHFLYDLHGLDAYGADTH